MIPREFHIETTRGSARAYQIDNDGDGNPRYVIHYLAIFKEYKGNNMKALKLKKYRGKWFGGGLLVEGFVGNDKQFEAYINEQIEKAEGEVDVP